MAKIGIDARFYGSIGKGLGRYTQKLIENLEQLDNENEYFIFLRRENFDEYVPQSGRFKKVLADFRWYTFAEQIYFPILLRKFKLDLMHFPHFNVPILYRKKFVLTIHDLILIHFPTVKGTTLSPFSYKLKYLAYKWNISSAIKRAAEIFTVSEFTKNDILRTYPKAGKKIFVTYEACENYCRISSKFSQQIFEKYGIMKPYLLYVGNAYPHKNLERLVCAMQEVILKYPHLVLALVGKEDYFYKALKTYVQENDLKQIKFLGYVADQDLDELYRNSAVYVFPSLYEGFGLPPLEAMAKGAPVVSSDHACMKEILGEAAHYVDASDVNGLSKGILDVLTDEKLRTKMIEKGYEQIKKYNWKTMAKDTLNIYESLR